MTINVQIGTLAAYKGQPALVTSVSDKIEVLLAADKTRRVRSKDLVVLHVGPLANLAELSPLASDASEAWELLSGDTATLKDLAELLHGDFTPKTAWAAWLTVIDGVYFEGTPSAITTKTAEAVTQELARRTAAKNEAVAQRAFITRLMNGECDEADHPPPTRGGRARLRTTRPFPIVA